MVRNIIISIFLIFLFGCKDLYFKNPQPRGGKVYDGSISELLNATVPKTINSTENSSILREIVNDTLRYIEINKNQNNLDIQLSFFNGITLSEQFADFEGLKFPFSSFDLVSEDALIEEFVALQKENIICINQKNEKDDSFYKIPIIFERNRKSNDINLYMSPFMLRDIEKFADKMKNEFSISEYYDNDSSKVYVADPSYMSFRKYLKNHDELEIEPIIFTDFIILELFNQLDDRINSDSTKYENIEGLVNFKNISELY